MPSICIEERGVSRIRRRKGLLSFRAAHGRPDNQRVLEAVGDPRKGLHAAWGDDHPVRRERAAGDGASSSFSPYTWAERPETYLLV